mmetsp:Transcript_54762/g.74858  ORF Transcript_54762/g.74858 Transcript_54762/m.74858 type:complete len:255 (-) Transcript_54762:133-897(-)
MCKALRLPISGTMPILRRRILEFKTASAVPARLPVPQEPPEDLSPAPPIIPAIPPRMSPPSSSDENSSDSDADGNAGLNKGPKTRKTKGRKRKDEAYKKIRELKRLRQSITAMAKNSSPSKLETVGIGMAATICDSVFSHEAAATSRSPNQGIVDDKRTLSDSKDVVKGALKQISTSADDAKLKDAYDEYVSLIGKGMQAVMNPRDTDHLRWQYMATSIREHKSDGRLIYDEVRLVFQDEKLPCVYGKDTTDSW